MGFLWYFDSHGIIRNYYISAVSGQARNMVVSGATRLAEALFALALDRHKKGHLHEAGVAYTRVLTLAPSHAACHHMVSVLARQAGQHELAVPALRKAIASAPREPHYRDDLLGLLHALNRTEEAASLLQEMCLLWPDRADLQARRAAAGNGDGDQPPCGDSMSVFM